jgi:hypothetical protein
MRFFTSHDVVVAKTDNLVMSIDMPVSRNLSCDTSDVNLADILNRLAFENLHHVHQAEQRARVKLYGIRNGNSSMGSQPVYCTPYGRYCGRSCYGLKALFTVTGRLYRKKTHLLAGSLFCMCITRASCTSRFEFSSEEHARQD